MSESADNKRLLRTQVKYLHQ